MHFYGFPGLVIYENTLFLDQIMRIDLSNVIHKNNPHHEVGAESKKPL